MISAVSVYQRVHMAVNIPAMEGLGPGRPGHRWTRGENRASMPERLLEVRGLATVFPTTHSDWCRPALLGRADEVIE